MSNILGNYIGFDESKLIEFKEFILKFDPESFTQIDDISNMIKTGKTISNFNDIIIHNLIHYFKFYLPKYISAFGNLKEFNNHGELYIGVNDFGEITGIPFNGDLEADFIDEIKHTLKSFVHCKNIDEVIGKIKFDIIKLSKSTSMLDDPISQIIDDHNLKYKIAKRAYMSYINAHNDWIEKMDHFNVKMSTFITDPTYRHEVAEYIRSKTTDPDFLKIADQLQRDHEFEILSGIEIGEQKSDKYNVYHWITNYKDDSVDYLKTIRPIRAGITCVNNDEVFIHQFQMLTNMRKRYIENNDNMNYYIIKCSIPTDNDDDIGFSNLGGDKVIYKVRDVIDGNPCCI